jgi:hypothetical protein
MPAITLLEKHIRSAEHSWSIGVSGAIAEFMYEQDEQIDINMEGAQLSAVTPRGALTIKLPDTTRSIAIEELSPCTKSWSQQLAFCLPAEKAVRDVNKVLTELGPDVSKQGILFKHTLP